MTNLSYTSEQAEAIIVVMTRSKWGRGRTLHEAISNLPAEKSEPMTIAVVTLPADTKIRIDKEGETFAEMVWVDNMGSTHYPAEANYFMLNDAGADKPLFRIIQKA